MFYFKTSPRADNHAALIHGYTREKFLAMGINAKPIPLAAQLEIKWVNGEIDKYKVRPVAMGHPGNIQLGVH